MAGAGVEVDVRLDVVERPHRLARQHLVGGPRRQHAALAEQNQASAQAGRQVEVVRGHRHRHAALGVQPAQQRRYLDLVAGVERGGRLVEQHQAGRLRQRARDDHPLLLAAAERREQAALEGERARRGQRLARNRQVLLALELEGAEVRVSAHEHDLEHRVLEREPGLLRDDRNALRDFTPGNAGQVAPVDHHAARRRRQHAAEQPQQCGLPRAVRPQDADQIAGRDLQRHAVQAGQPGAVDEADVSGLQQPAPRSSRCGRAPETRTSPRRTGRTGSRSGRSLRPPARSSTTRRRRPTRTRDS